MSTAASVDDGGRPVDPNAVSVHPVRVPPGVVPTSRTLIDIGEGVLVPPVGVGIWSWGEQKWGYGEEGFAMESVREAFEESQEIYSSACLWDTAEIYGKGESERILGTLIASHREKHPDAKIVVASKFLPLTRLFYPSSLIDALKASLQRCGLERFDLYQIHGPVGVRTIETLASSLAHAHSLNLIKAIGVSNYSVSEMERMQRALEKHGLKLASNQVELSLLRRRPIDSGFVKRAHEMGVAVLAYSPLGMGKLTGKYSKENPPSKKIQSNFGRVSWEELVPLLDVMKEIAEAHGKTLSQIALNWVVCKGAIPIPGAKNAKQARLNAESIGWRLTDEDIVRLDAVSLEGTNTLIWQHG
ncbi:hypothetical protein HK101_011609 [Irineochytrium annulatum]|nr:hypothetical protein HK101_011609 [Irineochytrium annulatum]